MSPVRFSARSARRRRGDPSSEVAGTTRTRFVSAGQIVAVGLMCFVIWLMFDARQLYNSAVASPLGTRRSVAISILRPIARVTSALSLDRVVDGGNRLLDRAANFSAIDRAASTSPAGRTSPPTRTRPNANRHERHPGTTSIVGGVTTTSLPPFTQPSPEHPLTVLEVGDSLGEDLSYGIEDLIGTNDAVDLVSADMVDSGLANVAYYNWPLELEQDLLVYHPQLVVVMLGGNDAQNFLVGDRVATVGTAYWRDAYGARVGEMMDEATAAGARVIWIGMPIMQSASLSAEMQLLDSVYASEAASHPRVTYMSSWKLFENGAGQYAEYLPDASGNLVEVRDPDGIHIAPPAGNDLIAQAVLNDISSTWGIDLEPSSASTTTVPPDDQ